ncbi:MAG: hypothetical protein AAGF31_07065 [Planctomycetota bacterium]
MADSPASIDQQAPKRLLPAWAVSVTVHTVLLTLMLLALRQAPPRGAAEEPGRDVGIVLRRADAQGDPYVGEDDLADPTEIDTSATDSNSDLTAALPDASAAASAAAFLPQPQGLGPQAGELQGIGDASEMTQGGAGRRRQSAGGEAVVKVFGVEGVGTKFVYAFDRSVSMNMDGRLKAAKQQLIESLAALESIHQFQIIFFNQRVTTPDLSGGQNRIAFASEQNKQQAERFVSSVLADGGTDRFTALRDALAFSPDVVFFLTDADDPMSVAELARIAQRNRRVGATICTIEFGSGPPHGRSNFLRQLATTTGGQYGYVDTTRLPR